MPKKSEMSSPVLSATCDAGELQLRELEPSDITADYIAWMNVPEIVQFTEQKFRRHTKASLTEFVQRILKSDGCLFGIFDDSKHIGNVGIGPVDWNHRLGEIGYIIGRREYWGKGVATATVGAVAGFALGEFGLEKVTAQVIDGNGASLRVLEKAGFTIEARLPRHVIFDGERRDQFMLGKFAG